MYNNVIIEQKSQDGVNLRNEGEMIKGPKGDSAYQVALNNGFKGTEEAWLASLVGAQGPMGPQGPQGTPGVKGIDGKDGHQGADGKPGKDGMPGPQGPKGDKGDIGEQGIQGETGATGADGKSATITIGTVTTLDAGSSATVENVGTNTDAIFNFGIPKGADGTSGTGGTGNVLSDVINSIVVVDELPATEEEGVLYLVKETITPDEPSGEIPSGTNIFTNYTSFTGYYLNSSGKISSLSTGYSYYISCEPSTTYTVNGVGNKLRAGSFSSTPVSGGTTSNMESNDGGTSLNITTGAEDIYLFIYLGTSDSSKTEDELISGCSVIKN